MRDNEYNSIKAKLYYKEIEQENSIYLQFIVKMLLCDKIKILI